MKWKKISSKTLYTHPRMVLTEDIVELPDGKQVPYLKYSRPNSASVICIRDGQVLLQREYSYPTGQDLYQFPGGAVDANEKPRDGALRELREEAGLQAAELKQLGAFYVENRRTDAKMHIFLATKLTEVEKTGGDLEEDISSYWFPIEKVNQMIRNGEITNYSLLAAWSLYTAAS